MTIPEKAVNARMKIEQETGTVYDEAIDVENSGHTDTETNIPIEPDDPSDEETGDLLHAARILFGEEEP